MIPRVSRQKQACFWQKQRHYFNFKWDDSSGNAQTSFSRCLLVKAVSASKTSAVALSKQWMLHCFFFLLSFFSHHFEMPKYLQFIDEIQLIVTWCPCCVYEGKMSAAYKKESANSMLCKLSCCRIFTLSLNIINHTSRSQILFYQHRFFLTALIRAAFFL